jgi:hypothetical protein
MTKCAWNIVIAISATPFLVATSCWNPHSSGTITQGETTSGRRPFCELPPAHEGELPIVTIARRALEGADTTVRLRVDTVITVADGVYEGSLVRMLPDSSTPRLGTGGLVWVDGETNCAIVLKRYE